MDLVVVAEGLAVAAASLQEEDTVEGSGGAEGAVIAPTESMRLGFGFAASIWRLLLHHNHPSASPCTD